MDRIEFTIFGATLAFANGVVWKELRQMFSSSSWFSSLVETSKKKKREGNTLFPKRIDGCFADTLFPKRIDIKTGSRVSLSRGRNIYEAIITGDKREKPGEVRAIFWSVLMRMETRFMFRCGGVPGKIWLVSPETDDSPGIKELIELYQGRTEVKVYPPTM